MRNIYLARDNLEAGMVRERLAARGIASVVKGDGVPFGPIPFATVWVADEDEGRARAMLDEDG